MTASVVPLRPGADDPLAAAEAALSALDRHLDRCKLAANTVKAYKRQTRAFVAWLAERAVEHPDAFADVVGAEAAVTAWRRHLIEGRAKPATVNQALAAVTLMYEQAGLRIAVKRARVPKPGEPDALTVAEQGAVERAAARRGVRDAAIVAVLLYAGARVEECARLELEDVAITARTGTVRLHGKGDEARTVPLPAIARARITDWLDERGRGAGPLWTGQRGRLTDSGIAQVVLAVGKAAGIDGLRPHRLRHTFATRLRQGGADPAQVQSLLGHSSLDTSARYFRAGTAETAAVVERVFE
ncbi:tyrosine-type recombinase/integrase [Actinoallomurus liliacearum]|uniref:Tyrosine-type recombinase/integrase n=1 Tax=Actinoallomurus liliacearum TaxID=1080073 RepID=A0ABP8TKV8_9ACTN